MKQNKVSARKSVADLHMSYDSGSFFCVEKGLTSLEGTPSVISGAFSCAGNLLTSLEGAPSSVGRNFYCRNNRLKSLQDVHRHVKQAGGIFFAQENLITSHVLGLLLIKGLREVVLDNERVQEILNRHLPSKGTLSVLEAQEELIEAGFDDFAQL